MSVKYSRHEYEYIMSSGAAKCSYSYSYVANYTAGNNGYLIVTIGYYCIMKYSTFSVVCTATV